MTHDDRTAWRYYAGTSIRSASNINEVIEIADILLAAEKERFPEQPAVDPVGDNEHGSYTQ
jgi:hypothetical protein